MKTPAELGFPYSSWRPGQRLAVRTAETAKTPHVIIQAPTGSGKSLIAAMLTQIDHQRSAILTATNALMAQYEALFPHLTPVRGMRNYECLAAHSELRSYFVLTRPDRIVTCDDGPCHSAVACSLKNCGCTYFDAYRQALAARSVLTNYSYWLATRRFSRGLGFVGRLLLDEAHALPEELMSAYRIELPRAIIRICPPTTARGWQEWAARELERLRPAGDDDLRVRRQRLVDSLSQLTRIDETWAWELVGERMAFEPTVPRLLLPLLCDADASVSRVYLSATVTPALLHLLDIDPLQMTVLVLTSRFPLERRPIYLVETARVQHNMAESARAYWHHRIDQIVGKRLDRKGLIHTVSYARQHEIVNASKYRGIMLAPPSAHALASALDRFRSMPPPAVLVSPSVATGLDFPGADAEYQIIAKVPFPDTRSPITEARMKATSRYRDHLTMQTLVQAAGRIVRSEEDRGETFVIDDHVNWFLGKNEDLQPAWFAEAVVRTGRVPPPLPKLKERD